MEIKQSLIADAIEQDLSAPLNVYKIEGYSDDVLIVGDDEFYADPDIDRRNIFVTFEDQDGAQGQIVAQYIRDKWAISVVPCIEGQPIPVGDYKLSVAAYSSVITISTPKALTFFGYQG